MNRVATVCEKSCTSHSCTGAIVIHKIQKQAIAPAMLPTLVIELSIFIKKIKSSPAAQTPTAVLKVKIIMSFILFTVFRHFLICWLCRRHMLTSIYHTDSILTRSDYMTFSFSPIDIVILALIILLVVLSIIHIVKNKGSCSGCNGCSACNQKNCCKNKNNKHTKHTF